MKSWIKGSRRDRDDSVPAVDARMPSTLIRIPACANDSVALGNAPAPHCQTPDARCEANGCQGIAESFEHGRQYSGGAVNSNAERCEIELAPEAPSDVGEGRKPLVLACSLTPAP